jgi:hypothetical protein
MEKLELYKMTVIVNIQNMQKAIGVSVSSVDWLIKKSYDELSKQQDTLIEHYNQAVKNEFFPNS